MSGENTVLAYPGGVQTAIERVHRQGGGSVVLHGNLLYDPTVTWRVRSSVVLDCNGAIIAPAMDGDLIHLDPSAFVLWPRVHIPERDWSGTVFTFDTRYGIYHPEWHTGPYRYYGAGVFGGYTRGVDAGDRPGNARVFYLHNRGNQRNAAMTWIQCLHHDSYFVDTVADLHARREPWWINGNHFSGCHWMFRRCLRTRGGGQIDGNVFDFFQTQPEGYSEVLWDLQLGDHNTLRGMQWDAHLYDQLLRVSDQQPRPQSNLIRSPDIHTEVTADVGENYVVTNDSFAPLSVVETGPDDGGDGGGGGGDGDGGGGDGAGGG